MKTLGLILILLTIGLCTFAQDEKLIIDSTPGKSTWVYPDSPLYPYKTFQPKVTAWPEYTEELRVKIAKQSNQVSRKVFTLQELNKLSKGIKTTEAQIVLLCDWQGQVKNVSYYFPQADSVILTETKLKKLSGEWKKQIIKFNFERRYDAIPEKEKTGVIGVSVYNFTVK